MLELRRTHSGFVATHFEVKAGLATTAAGPGTSGCKEQAENSCESCPPELSSSRSRPWSGRLSGRR